MFHVNTEGLNISFSFAHHRDVDLVLPLKLNPKKLVHVTDITLCDMLVDGKEFMGEACCTAEDPFQKEAGRKVALTRALQEAGLSRKVRQQVWIKYFSRVKDDDYLDSEAFYNLMQAYRNASFETQADVVQAFENVKVGIRKHV